MPSTRLVDTPAGRIYVQRAGSGPALVLVHGYLVSQHYFRAVRPQLEQRFDVIGLDLPGHGESDRPSSDRYAYDLVSHALAVADTMDALGVRRASVWGHSMGGGVAVTLAARQPDRVERLVAEDAMLYPQPMPLRGRIALLPGIGEVLFKRLYSRRDLASYLRGVHKDPRVFTDDDADFYWERFNRPGGRDAAYAGLRQIAALDGATADPGRVRCPSLLVWGEEDRTVPLAFGRRLAKQLAGARLEVIPASGHSPHEERPAEVLRTVLPFLTGDEAHRDHAGDEPRRRAD
jgi:pimeloyl-ACP methyl ester carboxylesterase